MPKVSVVIPAFRAAEKIGRAIASVLGQTMRDLEIIVVDDASGDATPQVAADQLAASGVPHKVIIQPKNGGPAAARNAGVRVATGEYVAFLDADDYWLPEKLECQVRSMDSDPAITLCGCQATWQPTDGSAPFPLFQDLPDILPQGWKILLWNCFIATPCAMARRIDLGIAPFDPSLRVGEDRDLWIRLATNGKVALVQDTQVIIELSSSSYMARHAQLIEDDTQPMIERHLRAFSNHIGLRDALLARGRIASQIGKALSMQPETFLRGSRYLLKAAVLGSDPFDNLRHMLMTAPLIRDIKAFAKSRRRTA